MLFLLLSRRGLETSDSIPSTIGTAMRVVRHPPLPNPMCESDPEYLSRNPLRPSHPKPSWLPTSPTSLHATLRAILVRRLRVVQRSVLSSCSVKCKPRTPTTTEVEVGGTLLMHCICPVTNFMFQEVDCLYGRTDGTVDHPTLSHRHLRFSFSSWLRMFLVRLIDLRDCQPSCHSTVLKLEASCLL